MKIIYVKHLESSSIVESSEPLVDNKGEYRLVNQFDIFEISTCLIADYLDQNLQALPQLLVDYQYFNISNNIITDEDAVGVASVFINNTSLEHLYMSNCGMREDSIKKVSEELVLSTSLKSLDLSEYLSTEPATKRMAIKVHSCLHPISPAIS